jgi:hypothetical protein
VSEAIHINDHGERVRVHQHHLNDRLHAHGDQPIAVNGNCDPTTIGQSALAAWFLGALGETVTTVRGGTITVGVQQIIADPGRREHAQLQRARDRRGKQFPGASPSLDIITTVEWGAKAPSAPIKRVGRPDKFVFHGTDGHAPQLDGKPVETLAEAKAYARSIQHDHMVSRGFIDSGHNFLVTRSGHVLEGRHGSVAAIKAGVMVDSAHCRTQNHQPGVEHEHVHGEQLTAAQREASLRLHEFICRHTDIKPSQVFPHKAFDGTDCPDGLQSGLAGFRADLASRLAHHGSKA